MSIQESLTLVSEGNIAVLEWDHIGEKANKLSTPIMKRFSEILNEVNNSKYEMLVIISKKPSIFIAGADIDEIKNLKTREETNAAVKGGQDIMNQIEDLKIPVLAAIHGACVGGGCELVLACDYRIATDHDSTKIGLPETKLGIIPGFGGCVRLPRVVGLQNSLDIILAGKTIPAAKAKKIGLVDRLANHAILRVEAMKYARELLKKNGTKKRKKVYEASGLMNMVLDGMGKGIVFSQAKKTVDANSKGHYPALYEALDVIKKTYGSSNRAQSLEIEREGFSNVATGEVSKNLINLFFMMENVKKKNGVGGTVEAKNVINMAVLGAGTMGGGIAYAAADRGVMVRMKDITKEAIDVGYKAAEKIWKKRQQKKQINKFQLTEKMSMISGGLDYDKFDKMDVVVEAIVENMDVKKKVIAETASKCKPDCIIATNTSSLSVNEMAKALNHPENFVGMHFFNPVDKMPLVEVIRGEKTSDLATATIFELAKKMGKTPVVVKDGPGFLVNRLLIPYLIEAAFFLEEGMDIKKVDDVFVKKFGMPMGPFHLMDEIGIDVCVKVSYIFEKALGERLQLPETLKKLKDTDRLGKKNKKGFYKWDEKGKKGEVDTTIYTDLGLARPTNPLSDDDLVGRAIYNMINEASLVLIEEKIVETPEEVDLGMIMGTGFPPFRGGLLRFADTVGSEKIVDALELYATKYGIRFRPCNPLRNMAKTHRKFY